MEPFLKWAGGKRWLMRRWATQLQSAAEGRQYFEPFLGSGACFFSLKPEKSTLSDVNQDLISTYMAIASDWKKVRMLLTRHSDLHSNEYYYKTRANKPDNNFELAAWFLYLNRSCFNGIYRVNQRGEFNVPKGDKEKIILASDDFEATSDLLNSAQVFCCDFEDTINKAGEGDFVFADPPYTVMHNVNGFIKYNEKLFSWSDQIRLANASVRAAGRGARILITNADHLSVHELYAGKQYEILDRSSVIGGGTGYRKATSEVAIMLGTW